MSENEMDEKLEELQEKGIISFSEWEKISEYESKSNVRFGDTILDCFLTKQGLCFGVGSMRFFRTKDLRLETESELFGLTPKESEELYCVFRNYKDDVVAYIPIRESEVDK